MAELPQVEAFDDVLVDLYRAHGRELLEMVWVFVGDKATAEDIVQEAFIRLHRAWPRIHDRNRVLAYLRTTAFNLARSGFRRRMVALRHRPAAPPDAPSAEAGVVLSEDQAEVAAALRRLSGRQRECVVLRFWGGLSDSEIATSIGLSVNSAKTHLRRGLAALEKDLEATR